MGKEREVPGIVITGMEADLVIHRLMDLYCGRRWQFPHFAQRFWAVMQERGLPWIDASELEAEAKALSLGSTVFVYNQEAELLGVCPPQQAVDFLKHRQKSEFSDWYLFNDAYQPCVILTHDNTWGICRLNDDQA